jgi:tetratricopeptide (TPR) repeat protein
VVTIHSVEEADGIPFLTMELIEGRPLSALIPPRGVALERFLELAVPLADAVSAAHRRGIVHRDLKPANVMVTAEGQVKVLDFGLAKLKEAALAGAELLSDLPTWEQTGEGRIVGTAAYMSPEQAEGKPMDHRSDLFSLGILMYEMTTGRRPFQGETSAGTLSSILKDTPVAVSELRPELPSELGRIVRRCLEKDPARRIQTAIDLRNELEDLKKDTDSGAAHGAATVSRKRFADPRPWLLLAPILAALALGALIAWGTRSRDAAPAGPAPNRVAVTVFENRTGDPSLDPIGVMAADRLLQGIAETGFVEVLPNPVASREPALAVSTATGAGTIVSGAYYLDGNEIQFQASITNARDGKLLFPLDPTKGTKASAAQALEPLRQRVMGAIAATFDPAAFWPHARPPRYDAYRELTAGIDLYGRDYAQAGSHFQRALANEPEYFWPQVFLYHTYLHMGENEKAEAVLKRVLVNRERYTPLELAWLDSMQAIHAARLADQAACYRRARELDPTHPISSFQLSGVALWMNRPRDALAALGKANFESWSRYEFGAWVFQNLADAHHLLAEHAAELAQAEQGLRRTPDHLGLRTAEARALIALGRLDDLSRAVSDSLALPADDSGNPGDLLLESAAELRVHGHREASLAMARRAVAWVRSRPPDAGTRNVARNALGRALFLAEGWDEAGTVFGELLTRDAKNVEAVGYLGVIAAGKGDRVAAQASSERLRRSTQRFLYGSHTLWRAAIAAHLGEKDEAVDLLREAFAQGQTYGLWIHSNATLEPLRGYAPFDELVRPKG